MRKLKILTHSLLLATTPSFFVYPQEIGQKAAHKVEEVYFDEPQSKAGHFFTYDKMIDLLNEIESGELEKKCTPQHLERIIQSVTFLAKQGALPDDSEESLSLDGDIEALLKEKANFFLWSPSDYRYMVMPALLNAQRDVILCGWIKDKAKRLARFVKKHKKEIIIGVIAAVTLGVVALSIGSAKEDASSSDSNEKDSSGPVPTDSSPVTDETPILKSVVENQIVSFKENIVNEQFFDSNQQLSLEENAKVLGSLFAHNSLNNIEHQIAYNPSLAQETPFMGPQWPVINGDSISLGHQEIDRVFSTDYSYLYSNQSKEVDINALAYQVRGERALSYGYYDQAVLDLGKAIEMNPTNPIPYLERSASYFNMGQYDCFLEDFYKFTSQDVKTPKTYPLSLSEFSLGFAKGLPSGVYESGEGMILFLTDFVTHPIHTSGQVIDSFSTLVNLVRADEWGVIGEVLSPEVHHLVTQWDTLPSEKRGELAGYALGKHGADILAPGALAKVASKSVKSAQELASICKNLQRAEGTLILETAAEIGSSAKIAEVIQTKSAIVAKELGFNAREIAQLENIGRMEGGFNNIAKNAPGSIQDISFANHALQRAIERGISRQSILETLVSPLKIEEIKIDNFGRPSQRFIGKKSEVVINPETQQVVSVNPTSTKKLEKLYNEISNAEN